MKSLVQRFHLEEYLNLTLASGLIFIPILYMEIYFAYNTDYGSHIGWAQDILANPHQVPSAVIAHAAWQWITLAVRVVTNQTLQFSALAVSFASLTAAVLILHTSLRKNLSALVSGALSLGLLVIAPLFLIEPFSNIWYFVNGYIGINVYHNPTILLLKPLVLLQFFFAIKILGQSRSHWLTILVTALVSMAAVFTKPSFIICLLPALGLLIFIKLIKKQPLDLRGLIFGIVLPSTAILVWQFLITFGPKADSSVVFAPLQVMSYYSKLLLPKFLLSAAFPVIVTLLTWKTAIQDRHIRLGWLTFIGGVIFTYLFAESGTRDISANFIWSGEITLFILFVSCVIFLAENNTLINNSVRRWLILTTGGLHVVFGIVYYFYLFFAWLPSA